TCRRAAAQLARRICRPIQAWPLFPYDLAPATHRLVQPATTARRIPRRTARISEPVEPDGRGMRPLLAGHLSRQHAFNARAEHLAGPSGQPQLSATGPHGPERPRVRSEVRAKALPLDGGV